MLPPPSNDDEAHTGLTQRVIIRILETKIQNEPSAQNPFALMAYHVVHTNEPRETTAGGLDILTSLLPALDSNPSLDSDTIDDC